MRQLIVPLDEVGPGIHVLGHVGLTQDGYNLLDEVLADAALNSTAPRAEEIDVLRNEFLNV